MKTVLTLLLVLAITILPARAQTEKSPAEWVAQLSADTLKERDAASAALLKLGGNAREEVRKALTSPDPETKSRAKELWATMHWFVVPGADADVQALLESGNEERNKIVNPEAWKSFLKKHGAPSLLLLAEIRATVSKDKFPLELLGIFLEETPPLDVAYLVSDTKDAALRENLETMLEIQTGYPTQKGVANRMQIQMTLEHYDKAYHLAREHPFVGDEEATDETIKTAADAMVRGKLLDQVLEESRNEVGAETKPEELCKEIAFFARLYTELGKTQEIEELCAAAGKNDLCAGAGDDSLKLVEAALKHAKLPAQIVILFRNVKSPPAIYLRSRARTMTGDTKAAEADWTIALQCADTAPDDQKKEGYFNLGVTMDEWCDPRSEIVWQKILTISPNTTIWDANAFLRMACIMENRKDYGEAAEYYQKAKPIAFKDGAGILIDMNGSEPKGMNEKDFQKMIDDLKAKAAKQKPGGEPKN